jgi:hypothetical protein
MFTFFNRRKILDFVTCPVFRKNYADRRAIFSIFLNIRYQRAGNTAHFRNIVLDILYTSINALNLSTPWRLSSAKHILPGVGSTPQLLWREAVVKFV